MFQFFYRLRIDTATSGSRPQPRHDPAVFPHCCFSHCCLPAPSVRVPPHGAPTGTPAKLKVGRGGNDGAGLGNAPKRGNTDIGVLYAPVGGL
jgi:hypothetical protein